MSDVAVTLARLDPLVEAGDPHAAAVMAGHLYYNNRSALVDRIEERRIALWEQAASAGDPVYTYLFGRALWDTAQHEDTDSKVRAVQSMVRAAEAGETRALLHLGDMYRQSSRSFKDDIPGGFPGGDQYYWWNKAAQAGDTSAACRFATNWFRNLKERDTPLPAYSGRAPVPTPEVETGLTHLKACAEAGRREPRPNPVFGAPALYLGRPNGGFGVTKWDTSNAQVTLALLQLEGRILPRNEDQAVDYLNQAKYDKERAASILSAIQASE